MPDANKLQTLATLLKAIADALSRRDDSAAQAAPQSRPEDVDQALAHAGDVARRVGLDPAALLTQQGQKPSEKYTDFEGEDRV